MSKLKISSVISAITKKDRLDELEVTVIDDTGKEHVLVLADEAQHQLIIGLLGTLSQTPERRRLRPLALARFQPQAQEIGISLLLQPGVAVHVQLTRPLSAYLVQLIETYDDPSSWIQSSGPAKQ